MRPIAVYEYNRKGGGSKKGGFWGCNIYTDYIVYVGQYDLPEKELDIIASFDVKGKEPWFEEYPID